MGRAWSASCWSTADRDCWSWPWWPSCSSAVPDAARRTARSTTTSATRRRSRPPASGRRRATASRTRAGRRSVEPYRFTELETPDVPHDWGSVHGQWDGGAMDGFMTHSGDLGDGLLHRRRSCRSTTALFEDSTLCGELLLLAPRADLAEPLLPDGRHVGRDHDERPLGLRDLRLPDDPRPARRGRGHAGRSTTSAGTACRSATPTTSPSSGRTSPTTTGRAAARAPSSTTCARTACRRSRS